MTTKLEAAARLKADALTAAPISTDLERKFLASLFKHADLKKFGLRLKSSDIRGYELTDDQVKALLEAIKKAGFPKEWKPRGRWLGARGLATADGKWPIIIEILRDRSTNGPINEIEISMGLHDTLDKSEKKLNVAGFKALVKEVTKTLGVKAYYGEMHYAGSGFTSDIDTPNSVTVETAKKLLKKYGTPKQSNSPSYKNGVNLDFKVEYATLRLTFLPELRYISCQVT